MEKNINKLIKPDSINNKNNPIKLKLMSLYESFGENKKLNFKFK